MGAPTLPQKDNQTLITDPGRRRSMRVLLSVPITVTGKTTSNQDFQEETRTLVVNAHGALISLAARVAAAQEVTLSNKATQHALPCRIVYVGTTQAGKAQMGVEFVKPTRSFWQIDFPPDDWVVPED
ncbi:MAG: PilZ domain-containing protein [Candidatus Acidiferrales bacterium]